MEEVRAASLPTLSVNATYTRLNKDRTVPFPASDGGTRTWIVNKKDSINITGSLAIPILAPASWAEWTRAADQLDSAKLLRARRAADGGHHHCPRLPDRLRAETAGGGEPAGPGQRAGAHAVLRLTPPRRDRQPGRLGTCGQDLEQNEALLQSSYANLYRSQEALGILLGEDEAGGRRKTCRRFPGMPRWSRRWRSRRDGADILALPAAGEGRGPLAQHELDGIPARTSPSSAGRSTRSVLVLDAADRLADQAVSPGSSTTVAPGTGAPTSGRRSSSRPASSSTSPSGRPTPTSATALDGRAAHHRRS
jgi:hypothetical protein